MAPELYLDGARASKEADMYAFGMVVYEVITGTRPFGDRKVVELPALTAQGWRPPMPEDPVATGFCQGTWELVERCWDEHPEQRPTVGQAVEHFERAARTSTVVDPSPTPVSIEIVDPRLEDSAKNLCQCHNPLCVSILTALQLICLLNRRRVAHAGSDRRLTPHACWSVAIEPSPSQPGGLEGSLTYYIACFVPSYHPGLRLVWDYLHKAALGLNILPLPRTYLLFSPLHVWDLRTALCYYVVLLNCFPVFPPSLTNITRSHCQ